MLFEKIITSLPQLTDAERQKVKAVVDSLFTEKPAVRSSSVPVTVTYSAMKTSFDCCGLSVMVPQGILFKRKKDKEAAAWLFTWAQEKFEIKDRRETLAIMTFLVSCLINYLRDIDVPVSVGIVLNNLRNTPRAVDFNFPGYLEAGLGSAIVQGVLNGNSK